MIEYPKLKKVGGLKNFAKHILFKAIVIFLVATLAGYLGGYIMQKNFRELTGYSPTRDAVMTTETEQDKKQGTSITIKSVTEAVRDKTTEFAYQAIDPPLRAMDWAAFWFSFSLIFMLAGWITGKLITLQQEVMSGGVDPVVVKNMKALEDKVNELVDEANRRSLTKK